MLLQLCTVLGQFLYKGVSRHEKSFVTALAVALLGATTLGAVASSASAPHKPAKNIVQTAVAAGSLKTLVSLVKQAGLAAALSGKGPLTVFAPTDAAFAKVPKATLAALARTRSKLKAVLLYHVVQGKFPAAAGRQAQVPDHVEGGRLSVRTRDGNVYINGARVIKANVRHWNGAHQHVINQVLIPTTTRPSSAAAPLRRRPARKAPRPRRVSVPGGAGRSRPITGRQGMRAVPLARDARSGSSSSVERGDALR